jgi:hypothetical protein
MMKGGGSALSYKPSKTNGALTGLLLGLIVFGFCLWGISFSLGKEDLLLKIMLYIPVFIFLIFFIINWISCCFLSYRIAPEGLIIFLGYAGISIPWDKIIAIKHVQGNIDMFSLISMNWKGFIRGFFSVTGIGRVKIYGTNIDDGLLIISTGKSNFGLTPADSGMIQMISEKSGQEIKVLNMDENPARKTREEILTFNWLTYINIFFLLVYIAYEAIFSPGSGAPRIIILFSVLAVALFFFNTSNAKRLFYFSSVGGNIMLALGLAVTALMFLATFYYLGI